MKNLIKIIGFEKEKINKLKEIKGIIGSEMYNFIDNKLNHIISEKCKDKGYEFSEMLTLLEYIEKKYGNINPIWEVYNKIKDSYIKSDVKNV